MLFVFSIGLLTNLYFFLGFALFSNIRIRKLFKSGTIQSKGPLQIVLGFALGLSLAVLLNGVLFMGQMWPNGGALIKVGLGMTMLLAAALLVFFFIKQERIFLTMLLRALLFIAVGLYYFPVF